MQKEKRKHSPISFSFIHRSFSPLHVAEIEVDRIMSRFQSKRARKVLFYLFYEPLLYSKFTEGDDTVGTKGAFACVFHILICHSGVR